MYKKLEEEIENDPSTQIKNEKLQMQLLDN